MKEKPVHCVVVFTGIHDYEREQWLKDVLSERYELIEREYNVKLQTTRMTFTLKK